MKWIQKATGLLMAICIFASIPMGNNTLAAKARPDRDEQAKILNELDILRGSGTSYELTKKLTRAEAAAFIVRLLGKDNHVVTQTSEYAFTSYADVSPDEWYAPYVGYCDKNGIINGYEDKTFRPTENLNERAFLKMLLTSLNYTYNKDFTWNNVYYHAYKAGILQDSKYEKQVITDNNENYFRGDVVEDIYYTLKAINKDTRLRMVQHFIDQLFLTEEEAIEYGLIEDDIKTEIEEVFADAKNTIEVVFNEEVFEPELEEIKVYKKSNSNQELIIDSIKKGDREYAFQIVFEEDQDMDVEYVLDLSSVVDKQGNKTLDMTMDFTGYRPDEVKSDFFMISKVKPISNNLIHLFFTHPINANVQNSSLYSIEKDDREVVKGNETNLQISLLSDTANGIAIYLNNSPLKSGEKYKMILDGDLISAYGVELRDGDGDSIFFEASSSSSKDAFELDDIKVLNDTTLKLEFSKSVNPVIAQQVFSYYLTTEDDDPIQITKATVDTADDTIVYLIVKTKFELKDEYALMINNITDITKQYSITEKEFEFTYSKEQKVYDVEIKNAFSIDAGTIGIKLDKALDVTAATTPENYTIKNVSDSDQLGSPQTVYYNPKKDPLLVKLYLPSGTVLKGKKTYEVTMSSDMLDSSGNKQQSSDKHTFKHDNSSLEDTVISDAVFIGEDTIKITFSKELAYNVENNSASNYYCYDEDKGPSSKKVPVSTIYIDGTTMILKFSGLSASKTYAVSFIKLTDFGNRITNNSNGNLNTVVSEGQ